MKIEVTEERGYCIVVVSEEITCDNFRDFSSALDGLLDDGVLDVIIDLSQVSYITSRGLGSIIGAYTVLKRRGGNLVVAGPSDEVLRALAITKLDRVLTVAPSRGVAVQMLASPPIGEPGPTTPASSA